jgi:hypothetical protein
MLHLVGYFVEEVFVYSTQQDIMFTRGADGRKCAGTNEPQGSRPLRIGNKATVSIETVASCCGIALPFAGEEDNESYLRALLWEELRGLQDQWKPSAGSYLRTASMTRHE